MSQAEIFEESIDESKRKLVSFQKIVGLEPIPGKDRIELAQVLGYKTIVKKGEFQVGDWCVYLEPDSYVDVSIPAFSFLAPRAKISPDGKARARIQVMKMGEAYSEGLAIPLNSISNLSIKPKEGKEITKQLGVIKYELGNRGTPRKMTWQRKLLRFVMKFLPISVKIWIGKQFKVSSASYASWPAGAPPKTDEERLQSNTWYLEALRGMECYSSIKMDGSSFTAFKKNGKFRVCSRNLELLPDGKPNHFLEVAAKYGLADKLSDGEAIQCELCGPAIQKNRLNLTEFKLYCFNVFKDGRQLGLDEAVKFCEKIQVDHVPVVERFVMSADMTVESFILKSAKQVYPSGFPAEGLVIRPVQPSSGKRLSCKVINPEFEIAIQKAHKKTKSKAA